MNNQKDKDDTESVRIGRGLLQRVRDLAVRERRSIRAQMEWMLEKFLASEKRR